MRLHRISPQEHEPVGIVIADGGRVPQSPKFAAFVWGPVPDDLSDLDVRDEVRELLIAS